MENVRDLFISSKKFKAEALNVQGYSISEVSKGKAKKQSFREKLDVDCDMDMIRNVLENKGRVYAYTRSSRVKALFVSRADGHTYSCNEIFLADDLKDDPIVNLMEAQVAFLIAQRASMYSDGKALFMDTVISEIFRKIAAITGREDREDLSKASVYPAWFRDRYGHRSLLPGALVRVRGRFRRNFRGHICF